MSGSARDARAARAAIFGFLASVGAIAILTWLPARFLADWAVYPINLDYAEAHGEGIIEATQYFEMSKRDFRRGLVNAAETLCILAAIYWLTAYLLGAGRLAAQSRSRFLGRSVLLGVALVFWTAFSFIMVAPRFIVGPLIDACTGRYIAAHPEQAFSSFASHHCGARVTNYLALGCILLVLALLVASLRLRYRQRIPGVEGPRVDSAPTNP